MGEVVFIHAYIIYKGVVTTLVQGVITTFIVLFASL